MNEQQQEYIQEQQIYYDDEIDNYGIQRVQSKSNQLQINDLLNKIIKQICQFKQLTNFTFDWNALLYYSCGWNKNLTMEYIIDSNQKHMKLIHYTKQFQNRQGYCGQGECSVCGETVPLIRNICGHVCCEQCWKMHAQWRLTQFFKDPFPICIKGQQECQVKMSYTLLEFLGKKDPKIFQKFIEVFCRSYSSINTSVKLCKGKPGFSCKKCFQIKKMYDIIQCQNCGNMICPRCGEKAHGQGQCFQLKNWKQLTQNSMDFVDFLNYKICPHCKQGVNKSQGCNYMTCKCGKPFCFYCSEKWQPHHKAHSSNPQDCPNFHRIKQLQVQKQMRRKNKQQFYNKVQQKITKLDSLAKKQQRVDKLKMITLNQIKKQFLITFKLYQSQLLSLKQICSFTQKVLCIIWGQTLALHFQQSKRRQFFCENINKNVQQIYDFLFEVVQKKYKLIIKSIKQSDYLTEKQRQQLKPQSIQKFEQDFLNKIKSIESLKKKTQLMLQQLVLQP